MGGANFVLYSAEKLKEYADVSVIAHQTSPIVAARFDAAGIPLHSLDAPTYTDKVFWLRHRKCLRDDVAAVERLAGRADIVISSMYPMNVIAQRMAGEKLQILYEPFSFFHDRAFMRNLGWAPGLFFALMRGVYGGEEIGATRGSDRLLTLCNAEAERVERIYGVRPDPVYEGVDTEIFHPDVEADTDYTGKNIILHSTGFDRYKGTDLVIAAMPKVVKKVPDVRLVVTYTREDPAALRRYRGFLENAGIAGNVEFLGTVPYERLPGLYRAATVYVEPGSERPMSLSVKEAMACSTPVVRGKDGWEEIEDGVQGFLVDPADADAYADRVCELLLDRALRGSMADAAVARIRQKFTWDMVARRIAGYAGLIETKG